MKKINKNKRSLRDSVEAYACLCVCACNCSCGCGLFKATSAQAVSGYETGLTTTSGRTRVLTAISN